MFEKYRKWIWIFVTEGRSAEEQELCTLHSSWISNCYFIIIVHAMKIQMSIMVIMIVRLDVGWFQRNHGDFGWLRRLP